jgi:hypothetical protein
MLDVGPAWGGVPWIGRVRKVEADPANPHYNLATRWGADMGGLWSVTGDEPQAISDSLESVAVGSFATDPTDRRVIILGTGHAQQSGRGVYRTEDEGAHWTQLDLSGGGFTNPLVCWEIRFHPLDPNRVYVAANSGLFESTDGGESFEGIFKPAASAYVTDIAFDFMDPDILYVGVWKQSDDPTNLSGVYKGDVGAAIPQFVKQGGGLPQTNCGRVSLTSALRPPNATVVYAAIANVAHEQRGVYRTTNGTTWTDVSPVPLDDGHLVRAWHNHTIGVSPWDSDLVLVGYVQLYMSTNGGASWTLTDVPHADQMDIAWSQLGATRRLLVASDGGVFTAYAEYRVFRVALRPPAPDLRDLLLRYRSRRPHADGHWGAGHRHQPLLPAVRHSPFRSRARRRRRDGCDRAVWGRWRRTCLRDQRSLERRSVLEGILDRRLGGRLDRDRLSFCLPAFLRVVSVDAAGRGGHTLHLDRQCCLGVGGWRR